MLIVVVPSFEAPPKRNRFSSLKCHSNVCCRALDRNEYNHITATYFLLAERKLRAQRVVATKKLRAYHRDGSHEGEAAADEANPIRGRTGSNPSSPNKKHKEAIDEASSSSIV
jgi:hypothetical protein